MDQVRWEFEAIGTRWDIFCGLGSASEGVVERAVRARIESFDADYSRFRDDSLVSNIAKHAGTFEMPEDFPKLWEVYTALYALTNGAFSPLVGSLLEDLGYDASYSLTARAVRHVPRLDEVISFDTSALTTTRPLLIDVGAAGKGYLVDIVGSILQEHGVSTFTINAGGDILHHGSDSVRVGLEDPDDTTKAVGVCAVRNESICASAGNRRRWGSVHHIVNPLTGSSPEHIKSTWVISDCALEADALATALYFAEPDALARQYQFAWAMVLADRSVKFSPRFKNAFFTEERLVESVKNG